MALWMRRGGASVALALTFASARALGSSLPDPSPPPIETAPSWNLPPPPKTVPPPPRRKTPVRRRPRPEADDKKPAVDAAPKHAPAPAEPPAPAPAPPEAPLPAPAPTAPPAPGPAPSTYDPDDAGLGSEGAQSPEATSPAPKPKTQAPKDTARPEPPVSAPPAPPPKRAAPAAPLPAPAPAPVSAPPAPPPKRAAPVAPLPAPAPQKPVVKEPLIAPPKALSPVSGPLSQPHVPTDRLLAHWFSSVGAARDEPFGATLMRAARVMVGRPYVATVIPAGEEVLDVNIRGFECVSFVESSLALARCVALGTPTDDCFAEQITELRYRGGKIDGFASRLNYFEEWLSDNERRGHIKGLTKELGGVPVLRRTAYMTRHPQAYPPLSDRHIYKQISNIEARLSRTPVLVIDANNITAVQDKLLDGDIVAIATFRRDILVRHVGFIERDAQGGIHLMHASERRHRVVVTRESLAEFVAHLPRHEGVLLARPLRPQRGEALTEAN